MLRLSDSQIARITDDRVATFSRQLAGRARDRHPDAVARITDDALAELMRGEIDASRAAGLRTRSEMERWADLACALGFGFSTDLDWAARLLAAGRPPLQTLGMIEETAAFAVRGA